MLVIIFNICVCRACWSCCGKGERLSLSYPGAKNIVMELVPEILEPYGQARKRGQVYVAKELFRVLAQQSAE